MSSSPAGLPRSPEPLPEEGSRRWAGPLPERLSRAAKLRIGLISDTHGLLRPEAVEALRGVDLLLHTGDVGGPELLASLEELAPLRVVRGNNDGGEWASSIPERAFFELGGGRRLLAIHDRKELSGPASSWGADVLVCGHSHRPAVTSEDGVLCVNAGSAGPRRFRLPAVVARLDVSPERIEAKLLELDLGS